MKCPKCELDMEYEEIKFPSGEWYCGECDAYYYGEQFPVDVCDGVIEVEEMVGERITD
jgi:ribosomal protein L37AE/L43A